MSKGASRVARRGTARPAAAGTRLWLRALGAVALAILFLASGATWWLHSALTLRNGTVELTVERGRSPMGVAEDWVNAGVDTPVWALQAWFRVSGQSRRIRAGSYAAEPGTTPRDLLDKMVRGDETLESLTLVEGWTFRQVRAALARAPGLRQTVAELDDTAVMTALGSPELPAEGWFFPDTYRYGRGVSDREVLRQAHAAMKHHLERAWAQRHSDLPLRSAQEALVLASIVEKETGRPSDRPQIAGVFANRLRLGMPLQTDPTVIYGLGPAFDGNLRRRDLMADTPFNTYTRRGLPPHPIAMPGLESIRAAVQPQATTALYFVARGDGSSQFSSTLDEHNRAVWQYQKMPAGKKAEGKP